MENAARSLRLRAPIAFQVLCQENLKGAEGKMLLSVLVLRSTWRNMKIGLAAALLFLWLLIRLQSKALQGHRSNMIKLGA